MGKSPVEKIGSVEALRDTSFAQRNSVYVPGKRGGTFDYTETDPYGNGDDNGVVFQNKRGGYWVRKFNRAIDIRKYGASVNNSASENDAAIQKALDNFPEVGIFIPNGRFEVNEIVISTDAIIVSNNGVLVGQDSTKNTFNLQSAGKVEIKGLGFDADYTPSSANDDPGKAVSGTVNKLEMHDCTIKVQGIVAKDASAVLINSCNLDSEITGTANGINLYDCVNYRLVNNEIRKYRYDGIKISTVNRVGERGIIANNSIYDCDESGIDAYDGGKRLVIANNTIDNSVSAGIGVKSQGSFGETGYSEKIVVIGNIITRASPGIFTNTVNGTPSDKTVISNNYIDDVGKGIWLRTKHVKCVNNTVENASNDAFHLGDKGETETVICNGNTVRGTAARGIYALGRTNFISNCIVIGASTKGIYTDPGFTDQRTSKIVYCEVIDRNSKDPTGLEINSTNDNTLIVGCEFKGLTTDFYDNGGNPVFHNNSFAREKGPTAERPSTNYAGQRYFDTDLGQPIWYDGAGWVDAQGAVV